VGDVLEFPTKATRDWVAVEEALNRALTQGGAEPAAIAQVLPRMKAYWRLCQRDWPVRIDLVLPRGATDDDQARIKASIEEGLRGLEKGVHQLLNELLLDRLEVELDLYVARTGS
jgi:hypothetical protein